MAGRQTRAPGGRCRGVTYFMFATGIENSDPTIENGRVRRDQMEECGFYGRWHEDFALAR